MFSGREILLYILVGRQSSVGLSHFCMYYKRGTDCLSFWSISKIFVERTHLENRESVALLEQRAGFLIAQKRGIVSAAGETGRHMSYPV